MRTPAEAETHYMELVNSLAAEVVSRMRTIGCTYCSGAIRSEARTVEAIVEEVRGFRRSDRENRLLDHDRDASMELKKREGYF